MAGPLNAKVIMARCSKTKKSFGIRIEQRGKDWLATWAFPIDERKASREGYSADSTVNLGGNADGYPGCPHCGSGSFALCMCEKIGCQGGARNHGSYFEYLCPWCGENCQMQSVSSVNVSGGAY
jgi:hypothetical protein